MSRPGSRTAALLERVTALEAAVDAGADAVPDPTADDVRRALTSVRGRLALGVDHTVVALVGGTGSGKSSLFNALSRLTFAEVGVRRPTTSDVTACVWAHDASALLDWLGVARERRIERESALDGETEADLRGLVLLDLPDHDSVEPAHRAVVDRLLPQADLLVFVVDPQKYADDALHTGYLRHLVGHEGAMVVVLNQLDTVPPAGRDALVADVDRLLREDGLDGVPVHAVSARTGAGLPQLRAVLAEAVAAHGLAERRAAAELADAGRLLAHAVGPTEPQPPATDTVVDALGAALGVVGAVATVRGWTRRAPGPVVTWGAAQADRVEEVRRRWLAAAGDRLPHAWRARVDGAVPSSDVLAAHAYSAVDDVPVPPRSTRGRAVATAVAVAAGALAAVLLGVAVGAAAGSGWTDTATLLATVAVAALAVAVGAAAVGVVAARGAAARRAAAYEGDVRAALARVVTQDLVQPTARVHDAHRALREAAEPAGLAAPDAPGPAGS